MEGAKLGVHSCFDQIRCLMSRTFFIWHGLGYWGLQWEFKKNCFILGIVHLIAVSKN